MSGIAAIIDFGGRPVERARVAKMAEAMRHRGPDGLHVWADSTAALAHCMLRTTPESLVEQQPLEEAGAGLVLAMDGRVDNWEGLRRELLGQGALLRDRSDAELVLKAYQAWGRDCLQRIEGDFAFVVWDARRREAFCARDRMGNRPFYYCWAGSALVLASELHAVLLEARLAERVNAGMLAELLAGEWKALDETLWEGVLRLPRAQSMVVDSSGPRLRKYWEPATDRTLPCKSEEDFFAHYREWLVERIRRLSRSHLPLAFDVSGGLDSSAVFCVAARLRHENRLIAPGLRGYTTLFPEDPHADEVEYARAVGAFTEIPILEVPRSRPGRDWYAERARRWRDFPGFPNASAFNDMRGQMAAAGCRATVTGESGDMWLDGSRLYYAEELASRGWRNLYDCVRADIAAFGAATTLRWLLRQGVFPLLAPRHQEGLRRWLRKPIAPRRDPSWLAPPLREALDRRQSPVLPHGTLGHAGQADTLDRLDDALMAQVTEREELDASLVGLELRHPFHDAGFVELMLAMPERFRLRGATNKFIHVKSLAGWVPEKVLQRQDKADFTQAFVDDVLQLDHDLPGDICRRRPDWVVGAEIERLLASLGEGRRFAWPMWVLWGLYGCDLALPDAHVRTGCDIADEHALRYGDAV